MVEFYRNQRIAHVFKDQKSKTYCSQVMSQFLRLMVQSGKRNVEGQQYQKLHSFCGV